MILHKMSKMSLMVKSVINLVITQSNTLHNNYSIANVRNYLHSCVRQIVLIGEKIAVNDTNVDDNTTRNTQEFPHALSSSCDKVNTTQELRIDQLRTNP